MRHRGAVHYAYLEGAARPDGELRAHLLTAAPWAGGVEEGSVVPVDELLCPVEPTKIVCVGRNYRAHAEELGNEVPSEPLLFLKPPSSLVAHGARIAWPAASDRVDYEGEIAVVIGRSFRGGSRDEAVASIFGVTCANDVTARDLQKKDGQFTRGKGFDTFCPCGPWIETSVGALDALEVSTVVDGEERQRGTTDLMIFSIPTLLDYIGSIMTLVPGDLVLTGTPAGVAPMVEGQTVEVTVGGVGTLRNVMGARATVPAAP